MILQDAEHSGHCRACKERVRQMLVALYGECRTGHQFPWPAKPEDYASTLIGDTLERIRAALCAMRGHRDFIKIALVPPCDDYLYGKKQILEFDESQHFSRQRLVSLSLYPGDLRYGFSAERWNNLCRSINAVDDTPIDRDERRSWYDTLRDLVPAIYGFEPTVRLYAGDCAWCSLDPANPNDQTRFQALLAGTAAVPEY
jgi:hypothetical protein